MPEDQNPEPTAVFAVVLSEAKDLILY